MSFHSLGLEADLLKALDKQGYQTPTPIQAQAIPIILQQKDVLGCAQTGTGKTAAFSLPIIQLLKNKSFQEQKKHIKCLILTPTRELAIQIDENIAAYNSYSNLKHTVIFGGVGQKSQTDALARGIDILIATPGRLLDLINQRYIQLNQLKIFVLDEADRMLDMGFINDVKKIVNIIPKQRQTLFFSATMPKEIQTLANTILNNPTKIEVTPPSSTADTIDQSLYYVDKPQKKKLLVHLLQEKSIPNALVFTRTKHGADKVVKDLLNVKIKAEAIHGNKSQNARQRALSNFKSGETRVMVATDIAARGIDIDDLSYVINYEIPNIPETYVHRIGRTGRAGASGKAISFCDDEEVPFIKDIEKLISKKIPLINNHPYELYISEKNSSKAAAKPKVQEKPKQRSKKTSSSNKKWYSNQR